MRDLAGVVEHPATEQGARAGAGAGERVAEVAAGGFARRIFRARNPHQRLDQQPLDDLGRQAAQIAAVEDHVALLDPAEFQEDLAGQLVQRAAGGVQMRGDGGEAGGGDAQRSQPGQGRSRLDPGRAWIGVRRDPRPSRCRAGPESHAIVRGSHPDRGAGTWWHPAASCARIPDSPSSPADRPSRIRKVSAWSSAVWPTSTCDRPRAAAQSADQSIAGAAGLIGQIAARRPALPVAARRAAPPAGRRRRRQSGPRRRLRGAGGGRRSPPRPQSLRRGTGAAAPSNRCRPRPRPPAAAACRAQGRRCGRGRAAGRRPRLRHPQPIETRASLACSAASVPG